MKIPGTKRIYMFVHFCYRHYSGVVFTPSVSLNPEGVGTYGCTACRKRFATAHGLEV